MNNYFVNFIQGLLRCHVFVFVYIQFISTCGTFINMFLFLNDAEKRVD